MSPRVSARREEEEEYSATPLELFFDLVFVFAITQVSHLLLEHLDWKGALESGMILLVVWWAWQYTTWATNELDPDKLPVRFLLFAIMMASLLMAVAIPEAFGDKALLFAGAYVFIQVFRQGFLTFSAAAAGSVERNRSLHIFTWFLFSGLFWIAGALVGDEARLLLWLVALFIDYLAPLITYPVPWLKSVEMEDWEVRSGHFAERFQLFTIIALGETIVLTGATTAKLDFDLVTAAAFAGAFISTVALWWLYFNYVATVFEQILDKAEGSRTLTGRDLYTYGHIPIIAGIILCAVGDEIVIAHPSEYLHTPELVAVVAGPTLYLLAYVPVRLRLVGTLPMKRVTGALACIGVGVFAALAHPAALVTAILLVAILIAVIVVEAIAPSRPGGEPEHHLIHSG